MIKARELAKVDSYATSLTIDSLFGCLCHKPCYKKVNPCPINRRVVMDFIVDKINLDEAIEIIMQITRVKRIIQEKVKSRKDLLIEQMKLYLTAMHERSAFSFVPDYRYPDDRFQHFKIIANEDINEGTCLFDLCAIKSVIEDDVSRSKNDDHHSQDQRLYSLGPLAFIQHSCDPNGKVTPGLDPVKLYFQAVKDIKQGEEITVSYGEGFFKEAECLCDACIEDPDDYFPRLNLMRRQTKKSRPSGTWMVTPEPSEEDPFPRCPGTTWKENRVKKVVNHALGRKSINVWVLFRKYPEHTLINLKTLLACADGLEQLQIYLEQLHTNSFARWRELIKRRPELDYSDEY